MWWEFLQHSVFTDHQFLALATLFCASALYWAAEFVVRKIKANKGS
jgi:hypothetical protein